MAVSSLLVVLTSALSSFISWAAWIFSTLGVTFIAWYIYWKSTRNKKLIDKIPGYKDWPLFGDVLHRPKDRSAIVKLLLNLCDKHRESHIFKLKVMEIPRIMLFYSAEIEKLTSSSTANIDKSPEYSTVHRWLGFGLLTSSGSRWKSKRRMLTPAFHFSILKDFLLLINNHARELREKLQKEFCDTGRSHDIYKVLTLSTLDIICETAMGVNVDALNDGQSDYVKAICLIKTGLSDRVRNPLLLSDMLYGLTPTGRKVNQAIDITHRFTLQLIKDRREAKEALDGADGKSGKHKPFLDLLLDCRDEDGNPLTDLDIREEVDTFMFEGHDTTSTALGFTFHLLGLNMEAQKKCQEELEMILVDPAKDITSADLSKMTYLECCIKESLRIFPTVPFFGRMLSEDTKLGDYMVPEGTSVSVFTMGLHRDPKVFPDPERFDPERFTQENCVKRSPFAYIPFSAGPRNCIGQKFAMMELKIILATVLQNFNIESMQSRDELQVRPSLVLEPINGIQVKLSSRV